MNKKVNSNILRVVGSAELSEGLEFGLDYKIILDCSVNKISEKDNEDSTVDRTYNARLINALVKDEKKSIMVKDKHKQSQLTRGAIYHLQSQVEDQRPEEEFYIYLQKMIRANLPEIYERYKLN